MIYRYPRYGELYDAWQAQRRVDRAGRLFGAQDFRDLQVLSQLAWFDEEFQENDPEVRELDRQGAQLHARGPEPDGRASSARSSGAVLPAYQRAAAAGQIEISTTPFYHPILPLLCDSNIASVSHPNVPLPPQFRYPQDARQQLELAAQYCARELGAAPAGLWPSEGSVSDEVFDLAAERGFQWTATDSGVLARTLGRAIGVDALYRPYRWNQGDREISVIFRDHFLSDLIGFVYSQMERGRGRRGLPASASARTAAASWPPAATRWCPSSSTARTPGNTTTATAGRSCASCTGASRKTGR